ncbi:unnamed protein product [Amoebophrya sp. A120]|nr:unnamed protein product [Amoebophrya sp. A120]|eukprot:GSA120T00016630001.1
MPLPGAVTALSYEDQRSEKAPLAPSHGDRAPPGAEIVVGFMGYEGAHAEDALLQLFNDYVAPVTSSYSTSPVNPRIARESSKHDEYSSKIRIIPRSVPSGGFPELLNQLVHRENLDYALVPVYNTSAGVVTQALEVLTSHVAEPEGCRLAAIPLAVGMRIRHHLMVAPGVLTNNTPEAPEKGTNASDGTGASHKLNAPTAAPTVEFLKQNLSVIRSHPQALKQCGAFLEALQPDVVIEEASSTATAAAQLLTSTPGGDGRGAETIRIPAALAGERAATLYKMQILKRDCQQDARNTSYFVLFKRRPKQLENDMTVTEPTSLQTLLADLSGARPGEIFGDKSADTGGAAAGEATWTSYGTTAGKAILATELQCYCDQHRDEQSKHAY